MSDGGSWERSERYVISKIEDCDAAREKQDSINKTQSEWNHETSSRIDKITTRLVAVSAAVGALVGTLTDNSGRLIGVIISAFTK
jgi:uncharacterized FlgJ-related protein